MSVSHVLLGILTEGPAHGYDLKHSHDSRLATTKPLAYAQVYATLARLERDGFVTVAGTAQEGGPEKTMYEITEEGREELDQWLGRTEDAGPYAADELVRKAVTAVRLGTDARAFLLRQREVHLARMSVLLAEQRDATDPAARIALDHSIAHLDADLDWLTTSAQRMAPPAGKDSPSHD